MQQTEDGGLTDHQVMALLLSVSGMAEQMGQPQTQVKALADNRGITLAEE